MLLVSTSCIYIGSMITLGMFGLGQWRRLLAYVCFFVSCLAVIAIEIQLVGNAPITIEMGEPLINPLNFAGGGAALGIANATPRLFAAECVLALIASSPFVISRLKRRRLASSLAQR